MINLATCEPLIRVEPKIITIMHSEIAGWVSQSEKVTAFFGHWPSFHDAEVVELSLWRGRIREEENEYIFPALTLKLHHWLLTNKTDAQGSLVTEKHAVTTFRFDGLEDFHADGFNHQNAIFSLLIEKKKKTDSETCYYFVKLEPSFGIDAQFICSGITVVESLATDKDGNLVE
ncbi:MAG: Imm50 family immunity protein [Nibricoccus sp.]